MDKRGQQIEPKLSTAEARNSYILCLPLHTKKDMRKIIYIICNVLLLTFTGCNHQPVTNQLAYIDSLIAKEQFDSACIIQNSLTEATMTEEDKAHYCLLSTQLGYVTNHPLPSDSLLEMALTYYNKVGNNQKLAETYYPKSVVRPN